ncbi:hypothetical protein BSKO_03069 [Bryopsis sp. KO-2023]|nr:hypothetical protein BSKO_03069 [Bryopsis sp. KO-2023]
MDHSTLDPEFSRRVVLVTGGASGIGLAVCKLFARKGCRVAVVDNNDQAGAGALSDLTRETGCSHEDLFFKCTDVGVESEVKEMMESIVGRFGRVDIAVLGAGIEGDAGPLADCAAENFQRVMQVNCFGTFFCMKAAINQMKGQEPCTVGAYSIVSIGSRSSVMSTPGMSAYCASKHAVLGLTRSVAKEAIRDGIRVNAMCPGATDTPLLHRVVENLGSSEEQAMDRIPYNRFATVEEIAEAVLFLCSSKCGFIVGHALVADGGVSCY